MSSVDAGYAWVVLSACFFISLIVDGFIYSFGAISNDLKEHYRCQEWSVSMIVSLSTGFYWLSAPLVSILCRKWTCRRVSIIGCLIGCSSLFLSTFLPRIELIWFVYGIVGGIGLGLTYLPTFIIIGFYFKKKQAIAMGIATAGSGLGSIVFPPLNRYLFDRFGWQVGIRLCSCLILLSSGFSWLLSSTNENEDKQEQETKMQLNNLSNTDEHSDNEPTNKKRWWKNKSLLLFSLANLFVVFGYLCPYIFLVPMSIKDQHIGMTDAVYLLSIIGLSNTIARFLSGWLTKMPRLTPTIVHNVGLFGAGISTMAVPFCSSKSSLIIYAIVWGIFTAFFISLNAVLVRQQIELKDYGNSLGLIFFCRGLSSLIAPPILGLISDLTSSFRISFLVGGFAWILAGFVHLSVKNGL